LFPQRLANALRDAAVAWPWISIGLTARPCRSGIACNLDNAGLRIDLHFATAQVWRDGRFMT
jgi:hypothetical protein